MNLTGAPAHCWLLCMLYVCSLLNATASPALGGLTPLQALTGQVPDISHFLHFSFWEPIYYKVDENEPDHRFPSQSNEKRGHWVGFADNKGDHLTWKILTDDTNTIISDLLSEVLLKHPPTSLTEFRQPLQVQSHLEMPGILVQLGHTQRT